MSAIEREPSNESHQMSHRMEAIKFICIIHNVDQFAFLSDRGLTFRLVNLGGFTNRSSGPCKLADPELFENSVGEDVEHFGAIIEI